MAVHVSPGVYTTEKDFSLYVPGIATSTFGVVGSAAKGPMNTLTFIASEGQLIDIFGQPDLRSISATVKTAYHLAIHAAIQYLRAGRQLWFVRVGTYESYATGVIRNATDIANSVTVRSLYPGTGYNNVTLVVSDGTIAGTYKIVVRDNNSVVETHDNLKVGLANIADADYIDTRINIGSGSTGIGKSTYIFVTDLTAEATLEAGTVTISGGADGGPADTADVIGETTGITRTGLQLFRDSEAVDVNLLAAPGRYESAILFELLDICETRGDCLGLLDPPMGLTSVQDVVDFHNGDLAGTGYPTAALNSSYGAFFWPWMKFFDGYNDEEVWIPPCGPVARAAANTDNNFDPWIAFAGLQRGRMLGALDLEYSPNQGERDLMYSGGNAVNPIVNFSVDGITLWGQRTLQRASTALDRINVRRMLLIARKVIASSVRFLVFDPNDFITWVRFTDLVNPTLRNIKNRRGLFDFRVVCDETTNTPERIDQNEMVGKLFLQPTKTAEMIEIEFNILPTGASFENV